MGHVGSDKKTPIDAGACYRPKKNGKNPLGEDAHFINLQGRGFGVADGVGGWSRRNVDSGRLAREIMSSCDLMVEASAAFDKGPPEDGDLRCMLEIALQYSTFAGTCTACVGRVSDNSLVVCNIGDSRVVVVRDGALPFRTEPQQKGFNRPLQIGRVNPGDSLEKAQLSRVDLVPGDVIVAATDGLFDNLFDFEIAALVTSLQGTHLPSSTATEMADALADAAVAAFSSAQVTPFAVASKEAGFRHVGGKHDDVTVVVIKVRFGSNFSLKFIRAPLYLRRFSSSSLVFHLINEQLTRSSSLRSSELAG